MQKPSEITVSPATKSMIEAVDESIQSLASHQPFSEEVNTKIKTAFLPDRVTASLNIEGIKVTRRQTLLMMDAMKLSENDNKAEQEIYNALKADEFVYELALSGQLLTSQAIRQVNRIIEKEINPTAGDFRKHNVEITGAQFQPPAHTEVPHLVDEMVNLFGKSSAVHAIIKSAWLHATFTNIHPFQDGNGRSGRLLQDYALLCGGFYPTGIPSSRRDDYYDALQAADGGDWDSLVSMICEFELSVVSKIQAIIDESKNRSQFIATLVSRAREKKSGALYKQYIVWRQRMMNFLNTLTVMCDDLSEASDELSVRTEPFELIDFQKWKEISETGRASQTWALKQTWYSEGSAFYQTILYFKRHFFKTEDLLSRDDLYGMVSVMMTGIPADPNARFSFDNYYDREIRFRELFFHADKMYVYSINGEERQTNYGVIQSCGCSEYVHSNVADVSEMIIEDLFVRKLGI